jgi:hypothetical protein
LKHAHALASKVVEKAARHVEVAVAAAGAEVADDGGGGLAAVRDGEGAAAVGAGVAAAVLRGVEGDDKVRCDAKGQRGGRARREQSKEERAQSPTHL